MEKYLALDCETGGIGSDVSLLTVWFGLYDSNFKLVAELDLKVKPNDGVYKCTGEALGINQINLAEHDKVAIDYRAAGTQLFEFLKNTSDNGATKLIPVGHNVKFDIVKVCENLISTGSWDKFVSYRVLDTGPIAQFLKLCGYLPQSVSGSLGSLAKHFSIEPQGALHEAKTDAVVTVEVLKALRNITIDGDLADDDA